MTDEINVELSDEGIDVSFDTNETVPHSSSHEEGGYDPLKLQNIPISGDLDLKSNDLIDGGTVIWDSSEQELIFNNIGGPAGQLTGYPIPNGDLANDSITVSTGVGLKNGGTVALGGTLNIQIEPEDFVGQFLEDDGNDNIDVRISRGLENDGFNSIRVDEDTDFTFTQAIDFLAGLDVQGDITDGGQVIWDESAQEIPNSALPSIQNSTLTNDTVTITAGDGLINGGPVGLGGTISLDANLGRGLELNADAIQFDEDTAYTLTSLLTTSAGIETSGDIADGATLIYDSANSQIEQDALENDSITITSGDGLSGGATISLGGSTTLDTVVSDFAGTFLSDDTFNNLEVDIGRGLEDDGSGNIQFDEDTAYTLTSLLTASDGIETNGDITDGATLIYDTSLSQIEQDALENDSLTVTAGDGLKNGGLVSLGSSTTLNIEPNDFAGFGVEDDGSDNLRLDEDADPTWSNSHTFNGGVTMGSAIDLQSTYQITNAPAPIGDTDLARKAYVDGVAQGLNLKDSVRVASTADIDLASAVDPNPVDGVTLNNGDRILLKNQTDGTENGIYVATTATDPTTWVRTADADEDAEVTSGMFTFAEEGTTNGNTSWIVTTDDPITLGVTSIVFSQFASAGEITAGDGLDKVGQTLSVDITDLIGQFVSDDGSNNFTVDIGDGLEDDGAGNIRVDEDFDYTFTQAIDFSNGIDTQGDVTDGAQVIWDSVGQEIPDSAMGSIENSTLANDSITINANDGLKSGGTVSLGGSVGIDVEPADFAGVFLSDDGADNLTVDIGTGLENDGSGNIRVDEDYDFTFTANVDFNGVTFSSGSLNMAGNNIDNVSNLEMDGDINGVGIDYSITEVTLIRGPINGGTSLELRTAGDGSHDITLRDGFNNQNLLVAKEGGPVEIPNTDLDLFDNTIKFQPASSGGSVTGLLFNSNVNAGSDQATIEFHDDYTYPSYINNSGNEQAALVFSTENDNSATSGPDSIVLDGVGGTFIGRGDLHLDDSDLLGANGDTVYDNSNNWVPATRIEQGTGSGLDADTLDGYEGSEFAALAEDEDITGQWDFNSFTTFTSSAGFTDSSQLQFGTNADFDWKYEPTSDELVLSDGNGVELIRQPRAGPTQFLQGIDSGSIEAPEDSFTQLANASVTSALTAGDRVGYTFALDNQTFFAIDGEADGAGGIQNTDVVIPNSQIQVQDGSVGAPAFSFDGDSNMGMYRESDRRLRFSVNGSDSVEIRDGLGSIDLRVIGGASIGGDLFFDKSDATIRTAGAGSDKLRLYDNANSQDIATFTEGATPTVQLPNVGSGSGTTAVFDGSNNLIKASSSRQYKENIEPFDVEWANVYDLEPKSFDFKQSGDEDFGYIAEEVEQIAPELVIYDDEGKPDALKYDRLVVHLLELLKQEKKRNDSMEERLDKIEEQLSNKGGFLSRLRGDN